MTAMCQGIQLIHTNPHAPVDHAEIQDGPGALQGGHHWGNTVSNNKWTSINLRC
jgi:hypothetical protein